MKKILAASLPSQPSPPPRPLSAPISAAAYYYKAPGLCGAAL